LYFGSMVGILVFANWARSGDVRAVFLCCPGGLSAYKIEGSLVSKTDETVTILDTNGKTQTLPAALIQGVEEVRKNTLYEWIYRLRWALTLILLAAFVLMATRWFNRDELREWVDSTWGFTKQILPLLLSGVMLAGFLLGQPGPNHEGIIPAQWVNWAVGGNSLWANLFASLFGAFMYFSTLTEVPIVQGLMGAGMGKGPAMAMLLSDPALSLPSIIVLRSIMGTQKTVVYVTLVVVMSTITGMIFGALA
ncbi:MAG: permease, partial [Solirubrobacterales bacterium]